MDGVRDYHIYVITYSAVIEIIKNYLLSFDYKDYRHID